MYLQIFSFSLIAVSNAVPLLRSRKQPHQKEFLSSFADGHQLRGFSENISRSQSMFSPYFHCEHLHPAKEGLPSQEGGDVTLVPIMTSQMFYAIFHGLSGTMRRHEKGNAPCCSENLMLIHDSTWAEDLNFIMCFINLRVLEITYSITGSE